MGKVIVDITISLDGFVAGSNISSESPMGNGGEELHRWVFGEKTEQDTLVLHELTENTGAVVLGNRTYADAIDGPWGGESPFASPAFVLTNHVPAKKVAGFTFITDGIESALNQAKAVSDAKNIWIMGGANVIQQYLDAGLVDEMELHIANIMLGAGRRLFANNESKQIKLERTRIIPSPLVTHIRYDVMK